MAIASPKPVTGTRTSRVMSSSGPYAASSVARARSVAATLRPIARLSATSAGAYRSTSGSRAYAISGRSVLGDVRQAVADLPVQIGEQDVAPIVEPAVSASTTAAGRLSLTAIERRKVVIRARAGVQRQQRAGDERTAAAEPSSQGDGGRDQQREQEMRRQVEDVRVADVVAVGEGHVRGEQREQQERPAHRRSARDGAVPPRRAAARPAELLPQVEPVHREVIAEAATAARSSPSCRASRTS